MKKCVACILLFLCVLSLQAQFLNAFGIMAGATEATHRYRYTNTEFDNNKYITGFNGSAFWELFDKNSFRWQTEIQYNQKGSVDKYDPTLKNRLHYICWNNFLKIRSELKIGTPYFLIGPRLEYLVFQKTTSPDMGSAYEKLHMSGSLGIGWEKEVFKGPKPFIELQFNPDVFKYAYDGGNYKIKNFVIELRVGAKLYWHRNRCPRANKK